MVKNNLIGRNWTFLLYPDSMNKDYRSILDDLHCQWVESPLHEFDVDNDGVIKKAHIHIVLAFEGNKSYDQIVEIADSVNGVVAPVDKNGNTSARVASIRGMVRYLIHLDNPEKYQYERSAIISHGGIDIDPYFQYAKEMEKRMISEMQAYCNAKSIYEYSDLLDYACLEHYNDWYDLLTVGHQSFVMINYLNSKRNKERSKTYYEENKRSRKKND